MKNCLHLKKLRFNIINNIINLMINYTIYENFHIHDK